MCNTFEKVITKSQKQGNYTIHHQDFYRYKVFMGCLEVLKSAYKKCKKLNVFYEQFLRKGKYLIKMWFSPFSWKQLKKLGRLCLYPFTALKTNERFLKYSQTDRLRNRWTRTHWGSRCQKMYKIVTVLLPIQKLIRANKYNQVQSFMESSNIKGRITLLATGSTLPKVIKTGGWQFY